MLPVHRFKFMYLTSMTKMAYNVHVTPPKSEPWLYCFSPFPFASFNFSSACYLWDDGGSELMFEAFCMTNKSELP
jgi:hypothetical protein